MYERTELVIINDIKEILNDISLEEKRLMLLEIVKECIEDGVIVTYNNEGVINVA
jgi:hypothetical protein